MNYKPLTIALVLFAAPAHAAFLPVWTGAGRNACNGACSPEWAMEQLTDAQRAELSEAMEAQPVAMPVALHDGDVFTWTSYARAGEPFVDHRGIVVAAGAPMAAEGWQLDGWSFLRKQDCTNWGVRDDTASMQPDTPAISAPVEALHPVMVSYGGGGIVLGGDAITLSEVTPITTVLIPPPVHPTPLAPVPLPAGIWLMLAALGTLGAALYSTTSNKE